MQVANEYRKLYLILQAYKTVSKKIIEAKRSQQLTLCFLLV